MFEKKEEGRREGEEEGGKRKRKKKSKNKNTGADREIEGGEQRVKKTYGGIVCHLRSTLRCSDRLS